MITLNGKQWSVCELLCSDLQPAGIPIIRRIQTNERCYSFYDPYRISISSNEHTCRTLSNRKERRLNRVGKKVHLTFRFGLISSHHSSSSFIRYNIMCHCVCVEHWSTSRTRSFEFLFISF